MKITWAERAERDLDIQLMIDEWIKDCARPKKGWLFISPAMAKGFLVKILKLYHPEVTP